MTPDNVDALIRVGGQPAPPFPEALKIANAIWTIRGYVIAWQEFFDTNGIGADGDLKETIDDISGQLDQASSFFESIIETVASIEKLKTSVREELGKKAISTKGLPKAQSDLKKANDVLKEKKAEYDKAEAAAAMGPQGRDPTPQDEKADEAFLSQPGKGYLRRLLGHGTKTSKTKWDPMNYNGMQMVPQIQAVHCARMLELKDFLQKDDEGNTFLTVPFYYGQCYAPGKGMNVFDEDQVRFDNNRALPIERSLTVQHAVQPVHATDILYVNVNI
jgi:hypothetical protein